MDFCTFYQLINNWGLPLMGESKLVDFSKQGSLPIPAKPPKDQGQIPEEGVSCGEPAAVAP